MASVWYHPESSHKGIKPLQALHEYIVADVPQRRTAKYAPPPATSVSATKSSAKPAAAPTAKPPVAAQLRKEASTSSRRGSASEDNASGRSTPQPAAAPSSLKRSDSTKSVGTKNKTAGDIFKSFAKAKAKPKDAAKSNDSTPAPTQDGKTRNIFFADEN